MTEPSDLLLFSTPSMAAIFSPRAHVRGMLAFEAALARAEARVGIIPQEAATAIAASCKEELFDVTALYHEAVLDIGRPEAQRIVKAICDHAVTSGRSLRQTAQANEQVTALLSSEEIDQALDPSRYLGSTDTFIDRALASYREVRSSRGGDRKRFP